MEESPRCVICGENATHALGTGDNLDLCNNLVCYQAAVELIKEKLEEAKGE